MREQSSRLTVRNQYPETPNVLYERDRQGHLAAVTDGTGRRTFERDDHGRETAEHLADGWIIRREYWPDNGQPKVVRLFDPEGKEVHTVAYDWNANGTVAGVKSGAGEFRYGYDEKSPNLLASLTGPVLKTTYAHEPDRNLIMEVNNHRFDAAATNGLGELVSSYHYQNDAANRRSRVEIQPDDTVGGWEWSYNDRGELTGAKPKNAELGILAYEYDSLGNRIRSNDGDDTATYEANGLNQYTSIRRSEFADPETLAHDADGNLFSDARGTYVWNAENRLVRAKLVDGTVAEYHYDHQGRRLRKAVANRIDGPTTTSFVYDGWNAIAEIEFSIATSTSPDVTVLTWGRDLTGKLQGAGGVGGLLAATTRTRKSESIEQRHFAYDASGNVTQVASNRGQVLAQYDYGPYGNLIKQSEPTSVSNHWRLSTKWEDSETSWICFGLRYHSADDGSWRSRDPIGEPGGENLYQFVGNDPISRYDSIGLSWQWPLIAEIVEAVVGTALFPLLFNQPETTVAITPKGLPEGLARQLFDRAKNGGGDLSIDEASQGDWD